MKLFTAVACIMLALVFGYLSGERKSENVVRSPQEIPDGETAISEIQRLKDQLQRTEQECERLREMSRDLPKLKAQAHELVNLKREIAARPPQLTTIHKDEAVATTTDEFGSNPAETAKLGMADEVSSVKEIDLFGELAMVGRPRANVPQTILEATKSATDLADLSQVSITRIEIGPDGAQTRNDLIVDVTKIKSGEAPDLPLKNSDAITVPSRVVAR